MTIAICEQSFSLATIPVRLQRRRLAGLTRGVQHEVAALLHYALDPRQPFKRRKHVVFVGEARSRDIETPFHVAYSTKIQPLAANHARVYAFELTRVRRHGLWLSEPKLSLVCKCASVQTVSGRIPRPAGRPRSGAGVQSSASTEAAPCGLSGIPDNAGGAARRRTSLLRSNRRRRTDGQIIVDQ